MSNGNLLLIGSESQICKGFLKSYSKKFNKIVGIDLPEKSSNLTTYLSVDFRQDISFKKIADFLEDLNLTFSNIIFTPGINYMNDTFGVTQSSP